MCMNVIYKFFDNKKTLSKLIKAFPIELQEDVKIVFKASSKAMTSKYIARGVSLGGEKQFCLSDNTNIEIPYRIYLADSIQQSDFAKLTQTQQIIYHCIFSLSNDGHVREKHIKSLLDQANIQQWVYPFVLKNSSEYVIQILDTIYQYLKHKDNTDIKVFCKQNLQVFLYYYSKMISYWNAFYRIDCYKYKDYVGHKLYIDCFGYTIDLEKNRKSQKSHP